MRNNQITLKIHRAQLKTIEKNDNVSLYSICFNGRDVSEYENFLIKFKDGIDNKTFEL